MPRCKFAAWLANTTHRVAVVGASGWIGMALVDRILATDLKLSDDRLRLFGSSARPFEMSGRDLAIETLDGAPPLGDGLWLVLHAGIIGADRVDSGDVLEVRRRNDAMLNQVFALAQTGQTERLVFLSSGAAGRPEVGGAAKQAYGRMKRDHELAVASWSERAGRPALIPRVFNLGGPYINHLEAYALGDFILQADRAGRIAIGASDPVTRSFVHVAEMARGVLEMAVDPAESGAPFDVCLGRIVELDDLAQAVFGTLGITPAIARPVGAGGLGDDYRGDGARFQAAIQALGDPPSSLDETIADTVAYLRQTGAIPPA